MFTGIIEEIGKVKNISIHGSSGKITIDAKKVLDGTNIGDSIAVNGVCLTVVQVMKDGFVADVMAETIRRSNLKNIQNGNYVNLERAMAADGRFGGHIVSGHIDGTGTIVSFQKEENATWVEVSAKPEILKYIVEKGSICIDGISLTVAKVDNETFSVSIIPHTGSSTTLTHSKPGDILNLETDIIGKYVAKIMSVKIDENEVEEKITLDMLSSLEY